MTRYRRPQQRQGFSLVELMIAMVVLAIGIMATMAMQYSALAGYNSAREVTGATEMIHSVEQLMRAEARDWEQQGDVQSSQPAYNGRPGLFQSISQAGMSGDWTSVFEEPTSLRMGTDDVDDGGRRFCVYAAGEESTQDEGFARIGIAVVYPAANSNWEDPDDCPEPGDGPGRDEVPLDSGDRIDLETKGYRVSHMSTTVRAMDSQFR